MFTNLINSLSLSQYVHFPTHINGNIIDLVFSSSLHSEIMVSNIYRLDLLSDHYLIAFKTNFTITSNQKTRITYIPIKLPYNSIVSIVALTFFIFRLFSILEFQIDFILCNANHDKALRILVNHK